MAKRVHYLNILVIDERRPASRLAGTRYAEKKRNERNATTGHALCRPPAAKLGHATQQPAMLHQDPGLSFLRKACRQVIM